MPQLVSGCRGKWEYRFKSLCRGRSWKRLSAAVLHTQAEHGEQLRELRAWREAPEFAESPRNCIVLVILVVSEFSFELSVAHS